MARGFLTVLVCFTLALMGVTGVHAHVVPPGAQDAHGPHDHLELHIISVIDAAHDSDHDDGDVDIEPLTKAFGKSTPVVAVAIVATLAGIVYALCRIVLTRVPVPPPLRPPKPPLRFFLLPPSHAPPASLH